MNVKYVKDTVKLPQSPLAFQYNETVAVDLHELEPGLWFLHIIDQFIRFSAGSTMTTKKPSEFVKHFIHDWISVHGPPQKFSGNGGELGGRGLFFFLTFFLLAFQICEQTTKI